MSLISDPVKPYAIGVGILILIACFGFYTKFIYDSGVSANELAHQKELQKQSTEQQKKYDILQGKFTTADQNLTNALREKKDAEDRLQRGVARGTTVLRVPVSCKSERVSGGETPAADPGASDATYAELDPAARPDYYALRDGINQTTEQLNTCKQILIDERK